jgi:DNA-binding MarR family transcriptional regulator
MTAFRLTRRLRAQDDEGLPATLGSALATVDREGPLTLGELAAREHVAPPSVTKVVEKLVTAGLVARVADESDRRVVRVRTTPTGRRRVAQNRKRRTAWLAAHLTELSPTDLATLDAAAVLLEQIVNSPAGDDE